MKTVVTLVRKYYKVVEVIVDNSLLEGKNDEEIGDFLIEEWVCKDEEELFNNAELEEGEPDDDDRYDVYDNDGNQTYGGHL